MLVKDLMTSAVSVVRPEDSVENAVRIMRGENVGIVPVCDVQNHVLGVITDRDILIRGHAASAAFSALSVQDLMSQQVNHSKIADRRAVVPHDFQSLI